MICSAVCASSLFVRIAVRCPRPNERCVVLRALSGAQRTVVPGSHRMCRLTLSLWSRCRLALNRLRLRIHHEVRHAQDTAEHASQNRQVRRWVDLFHDSDTLATTPPSRSTRTPRLPRRARWRVGLLLRRLRSLRRRRGALRWRSGVRNRRAQTRCRCLAVPHTG